MITAPISSWEGAEAYFTFADNPPVVLFILSLAAVVVVGSIVFGSMHEKECYVKVDKNGQ